MTSSTYIYDVDPDLSLGDTRLLINACKRHKLLRNQCAYVLATAFHETAHTMKPVRETLASTDAQAKARLTKAWKSGQLKWVKNDYWSSGYFGRGYVQLTHKANYIFVGDRLGVPLAERPSLALEPAIAVEIIVLGMGNGWFTGKDLADYITLTRSDYVGARRIVNGTDKAALIAGYAKQYDALLKAEGYGETPFKPEPQPPADNAHVAPGARPFPDVVHVEPSGKVKPGPVEKPYVEKSPWWVALFALGRGIASLLGMRK